MYSKIICFILATVLFITNLSAQDTPLWGNYVQARTNGTEPTLSDFSHAGYKRGDTPIPDVNFTVFDITNYGAIANDEISDRDAIEATIAAAEANGSGIIFFPPGRFLVNEVQGSIAQIRVSKGNIVFRGSGSGEGGTELFMKYNLEPTDPNKLWSVPYLFSFKPSVGDNTVSSITADATRETFRLQLASTGSLSTGDWIVLYSNDKNARQDFISPYVSETGWTNFESGVLVQEYHQIKRIESNTIVLHEPIHVNVKVQYNWQVKKYGHFENVGVEDIAFIGNWHETFKHHENATHDGGWSALQISRATNSWVRRSRFKDWNNSIVFSQSANSTVENVVLEGNPGHGAIRSNSSTHIMMRDVDDKAGHWHGPGVSGTSSGAVFLRIKSQGHSSPEMHASFPHTTLFDNIEIGLLYGRFGGAISNMPNHLDNLIFWNYKNIGETINNYKFWRLNDSRYGRVVKPIIVGFHGTPFTFVENQLLINESHGTPVTPVSLYEAQLNFRKTATSINENTESRVPTKYLLKQNFPNPFNPTTSISFSIPTDGYVELKVYDVLGTEVADLVSDYKTVGNYSYSFDATNLCSGLYFYILHSGHFMETKKMVILK